MNKLHKIVFAAIIAVFTLSVSQLMANNTNFVNAATKQTTHPKKSSKSNKYARYAKIRKRGNVYVITTSGGYYYKDAALKHPSKKRSYIAGKTIRIKKVVLYHGLRRYKLSNNFYITARHAKFNYHYTYKKAANRMVRDKLIIKKPKKHHKKKKPTKKSNDNEPINNTGATISNGGKIIESAKSPMDANADPYVGKHHEADLWIQNVNNTKTNFTFHNGNWLTIDAKSLDNGRDVESKNVPFIPRTDPYALKHQNGDFWLLQDSNSGKVVDVLEYFDFAWHDLFGKVYARWKNAERATENGGRFTQSINLPTEANADKFAGNHHNGDEWYLRSLDGDNWFIDIFTFYNGIWRNKEGREINNSTTINTRKYFESTVGPTDNEAIDPFADIHRNGDLWVQQAPNSDDIINVFTFFNGEWQDQYGQRYDNSKQKSTRDYVKSHGSPFEFYDNDPYKGQHKVGDKWVELSPLGFKTMYIYSKNQGWLLDINNNNVTN